MAESTNEPAPNPWAAIRDGMTERERAGWLAAQHGDGRPAVVLTRHRWVDGKISAKCDHESAMEAVRLYGGRVDRSTVVAYEDGDEHLGVWEQVWPPQGPPEVGELPEWELKLIDREFAERAERRAQHRRAIYITASAKRGKRTGLLMLCSGPDCGGAEMFAPGLTVADVVAAADAHIDAVGPVVPGVPSDAEA